MRMSALGRLGSMAAGTDLPGRQGCPGPRLAGVGTRSSFASFGTLVKRPVWYALVTAPLRERRGGARGGLALRARMTFDEIGFGLSSSGGFLRGRHGFEFSHNTSRRTPLLSILSANGF